MTSSDGGSIYRLPRTTLPSRYDLELAPDLEALTFSGTERIAIEVFAESGELILNADELEISNASITPGWGDDRAGAVELEVVLDQPLERVHFHPAQPLAPGRYTLACRFSGVLNDLLTGFYRSRYVDDAGVEHTIATTTFEETDARKAFPCFDEPDMKAVFGVTLVAPPDMLAVSNGAEIESEIRPDGSRRVRFSDTIPMSTYILAFVVGPLDATEWIDADGTPVRVVHVPGKGHLAQTAIDIAVHGLRFYREYYDIPYPAPKLDMVAMPDFAAGAMENLGCVIFREADLLLDPKNTSLPEMLRISEVVEHELAHMWFGDLVTLRWWNSVWLNEAFAQFMFLLCQADYRPEWQSFLAFSRIRAIGLHYDGLSSTRPIEIPVESADDASAMFDPPITYYKGASVLWMIEQYLGNDGFRSGVRRYLKTHAYGNTESSDLWDALEAENPHVPVREVMETWIFHGGHPLVSVSTKTPGAIVLSQSPFTYLPAEVLAGRPVQVASDWLVPVIVAPLGRRGEVQRTLLTTAPVELDVGPGPVVVNAGGSGFYHVHYDTDLLAPILEELASLEPLERFDLVSDAWTAVQSGRDSLRDFLDLVGRLSGETDPYVWMIVVGALRTIYRLAPESDLGALAAFVRRTLQPELGASRLEAPSQ